MKKSFFALIMMCSILTLQAQNNSSDSKDQNAEKTEKKIIVKKISRGDQNNMTDEEIQKMVEAELKEAGADGDVKVIVRKNGENQNMVIDGDDKVIVFKNEGKSACCAKSKGKCCAKAGAECPPDKAVMGVVLRNAGGANGAAIERIFEGSGASAAGLKEGDIILKINNTKITDVESAIGALSGLKINDKIKVSYLRNGETEKTNVTLGACTPEMCKPAGFKNFHFDSEEFKQQMREGAKELKEEAIKLKEKAKELKQELEMEWKQKNESSQQESSENLEIRYLSGSPNPSQGLLKISYSGSKSPIHVSVVDLSGKEIYSEKVNDFNGNYEKEINIEHAKGTVVLKITQGEKVLQEKIIIE
ncbi:MAG: PDZ domain-containing protein [Saprospiraceae bacterium]|nr:PDZ domain-containing protein [Saprospiraceae bacterium]